MKKIDKMLYDAKVLERKQRDYMRVCIIERNREQTDKFMVLGLERRFDTEEKAVQFCQDQAEGKPVSIIVMDIPRMPLCPERSVDLNATENEDADRGSPDVAADI